MEVFLTFDEDVDVRQPMVCEVIAGWHGWEQSDRLDVAVKEEFRRMNWRNRQIEVSRLALRRAAGMLVDPSGTFAQEAAWVDVYFPAPSSDQPEGLCGRFCTALMHRTLGSAQRSVLRAGRGM